MQKEPHKMGADASFLSAYFYSPWKEGREKRKQEELLETQEIDLPDGITGIGNYTFYGCRNLRCLKFTDSLKYIGGGSFTGCTSLRKLMVEMDINSDTCIKDVVSETFHEVFVEIQFRDIAESARLIFPEYYEEGVENTPARILETHFHGSGYRYRQCFFGKKIDFKRYDSLFSLAKVYEKPEILLPMAMGRLQYPYALQEKAEKSYKEYMKQNISLAGEYFLEREDWYEAILFLAEKIADEKEDLERLLEQALQVRHTAAVSLLMDIKNQRFKPYKRTFEF